MQQKVSIIMGIYNCENTLAQTLDSIMHQTYTNWELILCDDGSKDRTYEIAMRYASQDSRILLIQNEQNMGLPKSLNRCLEVSSGELVMRHDGDDLMVHNRIEKQVMYMDRHFCDVVGSGAYIFDDEDVWGIRQPSETPGPDCMSTGSPFIHPTTLFKRQVLLSVGGYSDNALTKQRLEDYDLWIKLYEKHYILKNIQEPLIFFREDQNSYTRKKKNFRIAETQARLLACKRLHLPPVNRLLALKPLLLLVIPAKWLRQHHLHKSSVRLRS